MNYWYSVYTTVFGLISLLFAFGFWMGKNWGWFGTVITLLFVTFAGALTLLDLPSIPGIPKFAAVSEIAYSVILLLYLFQPHIRAHSAECRNRIWRNVKFSGFRQNWRPSYSNQPPCLLALLDGGCLDPWRQDCLAR